MMLDPSDTLHSTMAVVRFSEVFRSSIASKVTSITSPRRRLTFAAEDPRNRMRVPLAWNSVRSDAVELAGAGGDGAIVEGATVVLSCVVARVVAVAALEAPGVPVVVLAAGLPVGVVPGVTF